MNPFDYSSEQIKKEANILRQNVIKMIAGAGSGHPAGSLGMADVVSALYFKILNHNPTDPKKEDRDRVILSNGHICPLLYAVLASTGYFPKEELSNLRKLGDKLQGHPSKKDFDLIEASSGSLGHGLSVACGMAMASQQNEKTYKTWCLMSDAEHQEGSLWEAVMFASKYKLRNLKAIVDVNNIQLSGDVDQVMPLDLLKTKYESFGWQVIEVDGHDTEDLLVKLEQANNFENGPFVVLAKTIPGRGVSFMEGKWQWHGKAPNTEETKKALEELSKKQ